MSLRKLLLLVSASALSVFGTTIDFIGPTLPVIGDPLVYKIFDVMLTQPTASNPKWSVAIQTNYGATIPGNPDLIPPFQFGNGQFYSISDLLFTWKGNDYGVALTSHDGYQAGNLYQVPAFQTSGDVMGIGVSPRPEQPVLLFAGGSLLGTGTLTGAKTGNGTTSALYTITDQFNAPSGFLGTGAFTLIASSYVCANGIIIANGDFGNTGGGGGGVPEPATFLPSAAALLFIGHRLIRNRRLARK